MACQVGRIYLQTVLSILENDILERHCAIQRWRSDQASMIDFKSLTSPKKRQCWKIAFALDTTGGVPGNGGESVDGDSPNLGGGTRLGRIASAGGRQLLEKLNSTRKNFPMKVFLVLLGFYAANALATILGQTGDWDVLVAGVVVAAIEGDRYGYVQKAFIIKNRKIAVVCGNG